MKFLDFLVNYGGLILTCITTIVALVLYVLKSKKCGRNVGLVDILLLIPELVKKAEDQFGAKKGTFKLDYVLDKVQLFALQKHIPINVEEITNYINEFVGATKCVNTFELKPSGRDSIGSDDAVDEVSQDSI